MDKEKYLGLILDSNMTWKDHLEKIKLKITALTGALRGIVRCLPLQIRYTIYNALVKPHLDYLIEVWGTAAKTNKLTLQRAQNKLIKRLFHYNFYISTDKIYKETKLMNLNQLYTFKTCILIRKILNKKIHTQINFSKKHQVQKIRLRNANNLILHIPRTNHGKQNIMFEGAKLYNKLPTDIKEAKSSATYKRLLKHYVYKTIK